MVPFSVSGGVLAFGDSITADITSDWFARGMGGVNGANLSRILGYYDYAVSGQQQANSWTLAGAKIDAGTRFAVWSLWSQNDGVTATAINADYDTYVASFISLCQARGVIPILITSIPSINITTVTNDNARKSINAKALALASSNVLVADMDAAMTDGASPARITAGWTDDGVHPNTAGAMVMGPVLQATIQAYWNAHP